VVDETRIRLEAIAFVRILREQWVAVPASRLDEFFVDGEHVFLKGQQGIFKPRELSRPLSIRTALDSPYTDNPAGNQILYDFAPRSREHENDGLKRCTEEELPLIYFLQVKRKPNPEYVIFAPVYVTGWDDASRRFLIDLSEQRPQLGAVTPSVQFPIEPSPMQIREIAKSYLTTTVQRRLHQARFRNQVLDAYRERCAVCVLRVRPLLDAAHIVPDVDPKPVIAVNEGLSLCAIHHRAFDAKILRYDTTYHVRIDLPPKHAIGEGEQSMLLAFDGRPLALPKDDRLWPAAV
jgi:putative restriction endonuclease